MNKKIIGMFVSILLIASIYPVTVPATNDTEDNGCVERWAIAMGFAFDGIMEDADGLRDILHSSSPELWPLDHIKLYSHDSWDNIIEGLRWIESQEDSNDITIWQSAGHGNLEGLASENGFISYADLDREFDKFDGFLLIMICACGSCNAHTKLAGENRIIITGRTPLDSCALCNYQETYNAHTYFIMHFVHPCYGAWSNKICDSVYGNDDGWVSAEEAFAYVEDSFEWPDEIWNTWCYAHLYMTDGVPRNLDITYIGEENLPPTASFTYTPENIDIGREITFNASCSYDYDGDIVGYEWNIMDITKTGKIVTHTFDEDGSYNIRLTVIDNEGDSDSATKIVNVVDNDPPEKPNVNGHAKGKTGIEYTYTAVTNDSNGDQVWYKWRWGDGSMSEWLGPHPSGEICEATYTWSEKGSYEIKVKAKDIYDEESEWGTLEISIPKNKRYINVSFLDFLQQYFPILRYIFDTMEIY